MLIALLIQDYYQTFKNCDPVCGEKRSDKRSVNKMILESFAMLTVFNMTPSFGIGVFNYAMGAVDFGIIWFAFVRINNELDSQHFWEWVNSDKGLYYLKIPYGLLGVSFVFYVIWTLIAIYWLPRDNAEKRLPAEMDKDGIDEYWIYDPDLKTRKKTSEEVKIVLVQPDSPLDNQTSSF